MSFGYSIGDFIAGANLSYQLIQALSGTKGAFIEYQEALVELGCLQQTFLQVGRMTTYPNLSPATVNAASHIVLSSMGLIGEFLERTKRYRGKFNGGVSGNAMSNSWQKMGWILFTREELKALTNALHVKLSSISLLLSTAEFNERMPAQVAQYQVKPHVSSSLPPSYTHLAEEIPESKEFQLQASNTIQGVQNTIGNPPNNEANLEFEARFARLEAILTKERIQDTATESQNALEPDLRRSVLEPKVQGIILDARQIPSDKPNETQDERENEKDETQDKDKEAGLFTRVEIFLKAERKKEVYDPILMADLETLLTKHAENRQTRSKPIRFRDAVGRKFSFPFDLCKTWAGMDDLIQQAFQNVDIIGPHVANGRYDLIGPNGEIILPRVWDSLIEPDWAIAMHIWPLPESEKLELAEKSDSELEDNDSGEGYEDSEKGRSNTAADSC